MLILLRSTGGIVSCPYRSMSARSISSHLRQISNAGHLPDRHNTICVVVLPHTYGQLGAHRADGREGPPCGRNAITAALALALLECILDKIGLSAR